MYLKLYRYWNTIPDEIQVFFWFCFYSRRVMGKTAQIFIRQSSSFDFGGIFRQYAKWSILFITTGI